MIRRFLFLVAALLAVATSAFPQKIQSLSPSSATAGSGSIPLNILGQFLQLPQPTVYWFSNSTNTTTPLNVSTYSVTQVSASIPANLLAAPDSALVYLVQGSNVSNQVTFTVNPALPILTNLSPNSAVAGSPGFTLTVNGMNFPPPIPSAPVSVTWDGMALTTNYVSSMQLTAVVPAALLTTVGPHNVSLNTPSPPAPLIFTVLTPLVLSNINPNTAMAGGPSFTLTANGSGFTQATRVIWNGSPLNTSFVNASQVTAVVSSTLIATAGTAQVALTDGAQTSQSLPFTIGTSLTLTSLSPPSAVAGGPSFNLMVNGSGFDIYTTIYWNTIPLPTVTVGPNQMTVTVAANLIAQTGTASISAKNSAQTSNSLTFTIVQPLTLTSLSPPSAVAGGSSFSLVVNGSGFDSSTTIYWNTTALPTVTMSANQMTVTVASTLIAQAGTASVTAKNSTQTSNALTFTIAPILSLTSLSPSSAVSGGSSFTLIVNGAGFDSSTTIYWNGAALPTVSSSANQISVTVGANLIAQAGIASVTAKNSTQTSNALTFTIAPILSLTSLSPSSAVAGGSSFTLIVNGSGFDSSTTIYWNGAALPTVSANGSQISVTVAANLIAQAGTASVTAKNSSQTSNALTFTISSTLSLTSLSPPSAVAGGPSFTLIVNGSGFDSSTTIYWNGAALPTVSANGSQISVTVAANLIAQAGTASVTAKNSSQTSNALTFTIAPPALTLTSISPTTAAAGSPGFTLVVNGSGFSANTLVTWNGNPLTTSFVNVAQLTTSVPAALIATAGTALVGVSSPGQTSPTPLQFAITQGLTLTSLSPSSTAAGGASFTLIVNGSGFAANTLVTWNGSPLTTSFVSAAQLTATVPANLIASPGTASVNVSSPGQASPSPLSFVVSSIITLTSLSPASIAPGGPSFTLTVNGAGFTAGTQVYWNGLALSTTITNATLMTASVPAALIAQAGTASVTAQNGNAVSNSLTFVISAQPLILSSLSPNSAPAGNPALTLVVFGSGFLPPSTTGTVLIPGTTVTWNGSTLSTQFVSPTQLTATVPAPLLVNPGTATVSVTGQPQPASLTFTITGPLTLTGISPSTIPSGGPAFTLTATGTGFTNATLLTWNGSTLSTTFVSATQLTALVPASFIASPGTAAVGVSATGQQPPAALQFIITQGVVLTSLSPASATAGGPAFTLTVNGNGFTSGTTVNWNSSALTTTFVSATQLTAAVPANLIAQPGSASITANNGNLVSNTLTFSIAPPTPAITSLSPATAAAGGPAFTLAITGSGFLPASTVSWNSTNLQVTYVSATQLTAAVTSDLIAQAGTASIVVHNSDLRSNPASFTINQPVPVITSITPSSVTAGSPAFTLTVTGTGFLSGAQVSLSTTALTTTFVSATQLTASVPANLIAQPGSPQITVSNPGGPASNAVILTIAAPAPVITSISPASVNAGGPTFTLTVTGTGFVSGAVVSLNSTALTTTFVSVTQVTAGVPASLITQPGTPQITLSNPGGPASNAVTLTIAAPPPVITSISPSTATSGGPAFSLTVTGTGFFSGATVLWNSTKLNTSFISATQLSAAVTSDLIVQPGTAQITANNNGSAASNAVSFTITPPTPTITSIAPAAVVAGGPAFTLTVTGTNFLPGATVSLNLIVPGNIIPARTTIAGIRSRRRTTPADATALTTTFVSDTQLTAVVPANLIAQAGVAQITAANTGGASSNSVNLTISNPTPIITNLTPSTYILGGPAFTLTVNGSNFVQGATIQVLLTTLPTTFVSSTQLTAVVPATLIPAAGMVLVTVTNPGTMPSNPLNLTVTAPTPTISIISPAMVQAGGPAFTLTVTGANFLPAATAFLNSSPLMTTFASPTQITAQVPASLIAQPGTAQITVANQGGSPSIAVTLTITPATPVLTSISPVSTRVGDPTFILSLTGTGFVPASIAQWNGSPLSTTFVSSTLLTATIDAGRLILPATASVTVVNPGPNGTTVVSNSLTFTINPVTPAISSIAPNSATAGDPALSLTVNGVGLLTLTIIQWNTTQLTTHFVNAGQVTADVPATLLAQAGTATVTAVNPGNNLSNAVTFTINPKPLPVITTLSKTSATAGDAAFTLTVTGTGFSAGAQVNFGTNPLATTLVSATQLTAAVPANLLLTPATFQVVVQQAGATSNAVSFVVNLPPPPALRLNPPANPVPAQQPTLDFGLNSGYPIAMSGTVTLTFASNATVPSDDPAIQFASGGRTMNFTVPPNSTALPPLQISTGTVAGTITVSVTLTAAGVNVTPAGASTTIPIAKSAPVILPGKVTLVHANGYLEVDITGFSTTRDMTQAVFHLNAAPGGSFTSSVITLPVSSLFTTWYTSAASTPFGSQFTYAQPFTVIGDTNEIQSVTVTLTNSAGTSVSVTSN